MELVRLVFILDEQSSTNETISILAASLTIPSALTLLVNVFTQPLEQARALGVFGGCGAIGNGTSITLYRYIIITDSSLLVLGLIIGAIFVEFASWHWVFWFVAIVALPIASICIFLVPTPKRIPSPLETRASRIESLDLPGVSVLTGLKFFYCRSFAGIY